MSLWWNILWQNGGNSLLNVVCWKVYVCVCVCVCARLCAYMCVTDVLASPYRLWIHPWKRWKEEAQRNEHEGVKDRKRKPMWQEAWHSKLPVTQNSREWQEVEIKELYQTNRRAVYHTHRYAHTHTYTRTHANTHTPRLITPCGCQPVTGNITHTNKFHITGRQGRI